MAKRGRKRLNIDGEEVKKLAAIGHTMQEVADYFDCAKATISTNFRTEFKLASHEFKNSLRRWQYERARRGSDSMLIHLGKNYLDQSDKVESKVKIQADVDLKSRAKECQELFDGYFGQEEGDLECDGGTEPMDTQAPDAVCDKEASPIPSDN